MMRMIMMNSDDEKYYKLIKPEESVTRTGAQKRVNMITIAMMNNDGEDNDVTAKQ